MKAFASMCDHVMNGNVPSTTLNLLFTANLTALRKKMDGCVRLPLVMS